MMNYFVGILRYDMERNPRKICNNYTTVFSCVPGPKKPWCFSGLNVEELYYVVPGVGDLGCGIGVITYWDYCQLTVCCDNSYFPNEGHKEFV
jgi:hypothetical protein